LFVPVTKYVYRVLFLTLGSVNVVDVGALFEDAKQRLAELNKR